MYSLKANFGSGLQLMQQVSFGGCTLSSYLDGDKRQRSKLEGNITFWGGSAASIINTDGMFIYCEVYLGSDLIYTGKLNKATRTISKENKIEMELEQDDNYTELLKKFDDEVYPGHVISPDYNYQTYLDSIYQGVTQAASPVTPNDYLYCSSLIKTELGIWDVTKAYLGAINVTPDEVWNAASLDSFCVYNNVAYVAVINTQGEEPGTGSSWAVIFEVLIYSQERSLFEFSGSNYDANNNYWFSAGCTTQAITEVLICVDVFESFRAHLGNLGYTLIKDNYLKYIQDNYPRQFRVAIYNKDQSEGFAVVKKWSVKDYIDIYKFLFNVDWRMEGTELVFKHPSELHLSVPTPVEGNEQYYIDRVFSMDWSNSEFAFDIKDKIFREQFIAGESPDLDYSDVKIVYGNPFTDTTDYELQQTDIDISFGLSPESKSDRIVLAIDTNVVVDIDALKLIDLVTAHYSDGRPFDKGEINGIEYQFTTLANEECSINIPYNRQDLLNFDNLIKSSFGDLQVTELQVNMESQSATIKAGK